jgi:hypothetical protein
MRITAIVENNTIKLLVHVPDGTNVQIDIPASSAAEPGLSTPRIAGLTAGAWVVADDFDDELPDEFWAPDEE